MRTLCGEEERHTIARQEWETSSRILVAVQSGQRMGSAPLLAHKGLGQQVGGGGIAFGVNPAIAKSFWYWVRSTPPWPTLPLRAVREPDSLLSGTRLRKSAFDTTTLSINITLAVEGSIDLNSF